jgi:hypothetical protein
MRSVIICIAVQLVLVLPWANAGVGRIHSYHPRWFSNAKRLSDAKATKAAKTEADGSEPKTAEVIVVGAGIAGKPRLLPHCGGEPLLDHVSVCYPQF